MDRLVDILHLKHFIMLFSKVILELSILSQIFYTFYDLSPTVYCRVLKLAQMVSKGAKEVLVSSELYSYNFQYEKV